MFVIDRLLENFVIRIRVGVNMLESVHVNSVLERSVALFSGILVSEHYRIIFSISIEVFFIDVITGKFRK